MHPQKFLLTAIFCLAILVSNSQDYQDQFKKLREKEDTSAQIVLLKKWEVATPKDPELFIAYFNYYATKSTREVISLDTDKKDGQSLEITDTGTGKPVAYMNSSLKFDADILQQGFTYIDKGISLYPTRLDMRFGKIYMLGQAGNYQEFTKNIVETIDYGNTIKNAWAWKDGKPLEDAKEFFLGSMQDYVGTIYNTENDGLLPLMRQISEAVLKYHPTHVESLSNVALTYLIIAEYDKALEYLLKAEKAAPGDVIVLNNIAQAYKRKHDKPNAKIYFEKIIKIGNAEDKEDAKAQMEQLNQ